MADLLIEGDSLLKFNGLNHQIFLVNLLNSENYYIFEVSAREDCFIDISLSSSIESLKKSKSKIVQPQYRKTNKTNCKLIVYPDQISLGQNFIGIKSNKNEFSEFIINFSQTPLKPLHNLSQRFTALLQTPTYYSYRIMNPNCLRLQIIIKPSNIPIFYSFEDRFPQKVHDFTSYEVSINQYNKLNLNDIYYPLSCLTPQISQNFIRLCFSIEDIQSEPKVIFLSLFLQDLTDIEINIDELTQEDIIPENILQKKIVFDQIFESNHGMDVLKNQQNWENLKKMTEFTYGEVEFLDILPALEYCKIKEKKVFWDIGCGTGKCLAAASIMFDGIEVKGVEYLESLYLQCTENMGKIDRFPKVEVFLGDLSDINWSDADILYCANLCFPESLNLSLVSKMRLLKRGSMAILLKPLTLPDYNLNISTEIQMSWGMASIYIYEKQE